MFYQYFAAAAPAALLLVTPVASAAQDPAVATAPVEAAPAASEPEVQPATPEAAAEAAPATQGDAVQPATPEAVAPAATCCTVPARTPIEIEIVDTVNSRANRTGQSFVIRLAEPLVIDGRTVAPAGTTGVGEVVHAARARAGGKAGELILAARYLDLAGTLIPLRSLRYGRRQGVDNSGAVNTANLVAAAVLPVASVLSFLVAGGEVDIPAGTRANAMTSAEIILPPID